VLDLTNVLAGPFATLHLSLLGAEVIKIENPDGGDLARKLGNVPEYNRMLLGTSFLAQNANKKSLTLNLKAQEGRQIFSQLLEKADVVVENFRPGVMERLGFSYEQMRRVNAKIIYCAITGFGQTGPDASKPAYDQIIQGLSGVMSINGDERLNPLRCGFPLCDTVGGLNAAFAIMAALYHRERTGEGQFIDIALLDSVMPLMGWVAANLLIGGQAPLPMGNENFTAAPSSMFRTRDGCINIAANQQQQWEDLADILGLPELKTDPRFQERDTRKANRYVLGPLLEARLRQESTEHWVEVLNGRGIPAGDILSLEQALNSAQVRHRRVIAEVEQPQIGPVKLFNMTAKFSRTPAEIESPPPGLSQHTREILEGLGYTGEEARQFAEKGII
jgi:crotonobetainyl-CoA:carnitine CoA-transferase CaiB-like acyl-CoA transferase